MNQTYDLFRSHPHRIDGAIHRKTATRLGLAYDHAQGHPVTAAEIRFGAGNCTTIMALDLTAAADLRDQLNALIHGHQCATRDTRRKRSARR